MQPFVEAVVFLIFSSLGIALYGRAIYRQCLNKCEDPVYAKKTVLNVTVRFILILLMMAIVSFLNRYFIIPKTVIYIFMAVMVLIFVSLIRKIRGIMQE